MGADAPDVLPALRRPAERLAGEKLVPELLHEHPALAALLKLLRDTAAQRRQIERFHDFHHLLRQNAADKAAVAVLKR